MTTLINTEQIALDWIKLQYTHPQSAQYMQLIESTDIMIHLNVSQPSKVLDICLKILSLDASDFIMANLGSGLLENLLNEAGLQVIDDIEALAQNNPLFRKSLMMVWQSGIPSDIWQRLQKIK